MNHMLPLLFTAAETPHLWISNPGMFGAILGSSVGIFGGIYGTLVGILAPRGKAKTLVFASHWIAGSAGIVLNGLSIAAKLADQPYAVWYGMGLPGLILILVLLPLTLVIRQRYHEAEQRRIEAENFRRS